jgi:TatD DNase family protein
MGMKEFVKDVEKQKMHVQKVELADAHCHLDLMTDDQLILASIHHGVLTIITNGVDKRTSKTALKLADGKNIFPAIGIDPENAMKIEEEYLDDELTEMSEMIKANREKIVAVGEIGLDYTKASNFNLVAKQRTVFERMLDAAKSAKLPVSVHSRNSMDDVLAILKERGMEKVHLHFFEGNVQQAKEAERLGYMISIPPVESTKRRAVIKDIAIDNLMAESDSPVVGATPRDVEKSVRMIAEVKGIEFERAAEILVINTKRFFNIHMKLGFMRS